MSEVLYFMMDPRILVPLLIAEAFAILVAYTDYCIGHPKSFGRKLYLKTKDLFRAIQRKMVHKKRIGD